MPFCKGFLSIATLVFCSAGISQTVLTDIREIHPKEIKVEGFRLNSSGEVEINGVAFRTRKSSFSRAWILNAKTRRVVWELEDADRSRRGRRLENFHDKISLSAGDYEVYYTTHFSSHWGRDDNSGFFEKIFDEVFNNDDYDEVYDDYRNEWREFHIKVTGNGRRYRDSEISELRNAFQEGAFISLTKLRDDEYIRKGFRLTEPLDIHIYAVGEANNDGTYDYAWIVNTKTREKVWKFNYHDSEHAGGARKNRVLDRTISLPAGDYLALVVTDDSHSYHDWNSSPPFDPAFWGLTLKTRNPTSRRKVELFDPDDIKNENVIISFTRMRNNEFVSEGFSCNRDLDLRIYALGEGNRGEMYDYGWIVDAKTHRKVWQMEYRNTEHAGGGEKNRLFDDVVQFKKGGYIVYYVSDDSHSYWDWNTSPPSDQESWGITLSGAGNNFKKSDISSLSETDKGKILAQIVGIRDYERERKKFTLSKDSKVRIYALGEGSGGSMYDYGWIEETGNGRVVWEMTYRRTEHAGGAKKNRMFNDTIFMKKGEYTVFYESDDSHSFEDWNSEPPYDPANWGITIYEADDN